MSKINTDRIGTRDGTLDIDVKSIMVRSDAMENLGDYEQGIELAHAHEFIVKGDSWYTAKTGQVPYVLTGVWEYDKERLEIYGAWDHSSLKNRDKEDSHSARAITYDHGSEFPDKSLGKELQRLKNSSSDYQIVDSFEKGATITERNQALRFEADGRLYRWAGDLPKTVAAGSSPETAGGAQVGAWLEVSDLTLRQELANPAKGAAMVARGVMAVDSIADLLTLPEGQRKEGLRYLVKGYHAGSDVGGGEFYWNPSSTEIVDNGTVFSAQGLSEGRYKRKIQSGYSPKDFGAKGDGQASDASAIQAMMQSQVSPVEWGTKNDVYVVDQQCSHSYSKGAVVEWRGGGAQVVTPASAERLNTTLALEVHGGEVRISDLTIKVNYRSMRPLAIRNTHPVMDSSDKTDCYLSNITAEEFATNENIGQHAGGIIVIGAFSRATFNGCVVRNGLNSLLAWESSRTLAGFSVAGSENGGAVEKVSFESCEIDGLRGETPAVNIGINGISCFDPHTRSSIDLPTTCTITNLISRNVWGGDIKLQRFSYYVNECSFYNDEEGPDVTARAFIRLQGGTGQVSNIRFYMRSYPKEAFEISSFGSFEKTAANLRHCYAYNLTSKLCRRFLGTFSSAGKKPANLRATDCSTEGRYNEFGYIHCGGDTAPIVRLDDCRADSLELDTSRADYENETSPWFLYVRIPPASGTTRMSMVDCGYTGENTVYPVRVRVLMHLEGHGNYGFAFPTGGLGSPLQAGAVYGSPLMTAGAISTNIGPNSGNYFPGVMMHQSARIAPNETYEFQLHNGVNLAASSFCVIKLDTSRFYFAMFIWDGTMTDLRADQHFSQKVLLSSSEPAAFDVADRLYVWGSGDKIKVRSTRAADNTVSLFSA